MDWTQVAAIVAVLTGVSGLSWRAMSLNFRRLEERIDAVAVASTTGLAHVGAQVAALDTRLDEKIDGLGTRLDDKADLLGTRLDDKADQLGTRLDDKIDQLGTRLDDKIDQLGTRLDDKIDAVAARLDEKIDLKVDGLAALMGARFDTVGHRLGSLESDMALVKQHLFGHPAA